MIKMLRLEIVMYSSRDLDDKSRQETVRSLRKLDLKKHAKDQLEGQSDKCICS